MTLTMASHIMQLTGDDSERSQPSAGRAVFLALSAFSVGQAIQADDGFYCPIGLLWLTGGILTCIAGLTRSAGRLFSKHGQGPVTITLVCCLYFQLGQLFLYGSFRYVELQDTKEYGPYLLGILFVALAVPGLILGSKAVRWYFFLAVVAAHLFVGRWVITHSPNRRVDVVLFHRSAVNALIDGENPYSIAFPNLYANVRRGFDYYGPGLYENGRSTFGFMYPALSLLLSALGQLLAGDFRYSALLASSIAAFLMAFTGGGRAAQLAALLFLFTPRGFFVVEMGWTEPFVVLMLSLTVFCAFRSNRLLSVGTGLLLAIKQYLVFTVPSIFLLLPRPLSSKHTALFFAKACFTAGIVTLPLALWNLPAYIRSTVLFHFRQPFRPDSLSYTAWLVNQGVAPATAWFGFLALLPATAFVLCRAQRSPSGFSAGVSLTFLAFFCFNQQAFANYYYFIVGALCCSVASMASLQE